MTGKEFKVSPYRAPIEILTRNKEEIKKEGAYYQFVKAVKNVTKFFYVSNRNKPIKSPTGQSYVVTSSEYKTSYPNLVQSYEMYFISRASFDAIEKVLDSHIINHFDGGNLILVKKN